MATNFLMFVWIKSSIMCEITKKCMSNSKQGKLFGESHSVFLIMKCVAVTIDYKLESMRYKWKKKKKKNDYDLLHEKNKASFHVFHLFSSWMPLMYKNVTYAEICIIFSFIVYRSFMLFLLFFCGKKGRIEKNSNETVNFLTFFFPHWHIEFRHFQLPIIPLH